MNRDADWFQDVRKEIQGLAKALQARLDGETIRGFREEDLFLLNIGYDFSTYCTSGVFQTSEGPILFRNLDWDGEEFKNFTVETHFQKEGQIVFRAIQFLGQVGVLTGMKPYAYGVALNYRKTPGTGTLGLEIVNNFFQFAFKNGWSASLLLRYTLEHDSDFVQARNKLESTELISPCYMVLAGTERDQGAVIERSREDHITRNFDNPFENRKYIVQTNHDIPKPTNQDGHWAGDDALLNESLGMGTEERREAACIFLASIDESHLQSQLMQMLKDLWPVSNDLTIFSSLLSPSTNEIELFIHPQQPESLKN